MHHGGSGCNCNLIRLAPENEVAEAGRGVVVLQRVLLQYRLDPG